MSTPPSSSSSAASATDLATSLDSAVRAGRSATIARLGRDATLWLAVVPLWARDIAQAASFPAPDLNGFIEQAMSAGWCEVRGSLSDDEPGGVLFWMPDAVRREVLDVLTAQEWGSLLGWAQDIAERILSVQVRDDTFPDVGAIPGALLDWAHLVTTGQPDQELVESVRSAVQAGNLGGAQQLVAAGEALAPLLYGTAELALDRARRLMSLGARRRNDRRALARYQDRPELVAAVTELLRVRNSQGTGEDTTKWALHLRGAGGIGKTMLIRDLASGRYAVKHEIDDFPVIRADFDHIDADYPTRRPIQLLLELADELALHAAAVTRADRALASFRATATSAHERRSDFRDQTGPVLDDPLVRRAVDAFAQVLESMPGTLIVLDTCEELAKADAGAPDAPAVTATFDIIERIYLKSPSTRVLLAGRRPLPDRGYLTVTEVEGFTVDEARDYLASFSTRELAPGLADAMIRQSAAVDGQVPPPGVLPGRVSPFDLALYLSWADEDPGLTQERVLAGSDAYVQGRIIERLRDPLILDVLPELAMIGHCRVKTLASLGAVPGDPALLGARLAEQEWIDVTGDSPVFVTPKPVLGLRLRRYFGAPSRADQYRARIERLTATLTGRIRSALLADIDVDELLAVLRLSAPAEAARLWDRVAYRAIEPPGRWGWMLNVTRRVLGESEDEQWPCGAAIRASVLACQIAARRRASATFNPYDAWVRVRANADSHPDPGAAAVLRARAALGMLPYTDNDESVWTDASLPPVSELLAAAAADTLERLLESGQFTKAERLVAESPHLYAGLGGLAGPQVQAWALAARDRLAVENGRVMGTIPLPGPELGLGLMRARDLEELAAQPGPSPAWPDWIPPGDLLARVRLESGLLQPPDDTVLDTWEAYAAENLRDIDRERLAALCLRTRLDRAPLERSVLDRWEQLDSYPPSRGPACTAHDLVPPLCAVLAEAELVAGRPDRALELVDQRRDEALGTRQETGDDATITAMDEQTIRIVRRYRIDGHRPLLARLAAQTRQAAVGYPVPPAQLRLRDSACRALAVVHHESQDVVTGAEVTRRPAGWHTWWQCQQTLPDETPGFRWPVTFRRDDLPADGYLAADIGIDLDEARRLGGVGLADQLEERFSEWLSRCSDAKPPVRSHDRYRDVRVGLRKAALTGAEFKPAPDPPLRIIAELDSGVPARLAAELVFEEAELIAPRLPNVAAALFAAATRLFHETGDGIGRLLAGTAYRSLTGDGSLMQAASVELTGTGGAIAQALSGLDEKAGPWSYWAAQLERTTAPETESRLSYPAPMPDSGPVSRPRPRRLIRSRLLGWLLGSLTAVGGALAGLVSSDLIATLLAAWIGAIVVLAGLLTVLISPTIPAFRRVLDGRGVGAFPLAIQHFQVTIRAADASLIMRTEIGPPANPGSFWGGGRRGVASILWTAWMCTLPYLDLAEALIRKIRKPTGYTARLPAPEVEPVFMEWLDHPPTADERWWRDPAGPASGSITLDGADPTQPWEQILSANFGSFAAGHVRWRRLMGGSVEAYSTRNAADIEINTPIAWQNSLISSYDKHLAVLRADGRPIRVRHAIGRAVMTSAGPRLDISGDAVEISGTSQLLGVDELTRRTPQLIILQAEPVTDGIVPRMDDDHREMLTLAAELMEAGVPTVLIVPAVPGRLTGQLTPFVTKLVASRLSYSPQWLRNRFRSVLAAMPQLAAGNDLSILDDLVLMVNARRYS